LALVAPLLAAIDDPAYLNLRQTLAQEQAALDALGTDPRVRAYPLLDSLLDGDRAAPAATPATPEPAPWYSRLAPRIVRVQPTAGAGLRQRPDREAALAALQVEASLARAAIERRDPAAYAAALARIERGLQPLLAGSPQLARKHGILAELKEVQLRADAALAGTTLQQLRALRGQCCAHVALAPALRCSPHGTIPRRPHDPVPQRAVLAGAGGARRAAGAGAAAGPRLRAGALPRHRLHHHRRRRHRHPAGDDVRAGAAVEPAAAAVPRLAPASRTPGA